MGEEGEAAVGSGPASSIEREAKLEAGLHFSLPDLHEVLPGLSALALPDSRLQAVYIDTEDLRLMRWGITLRHRHDAVGGAGAEDAWTVKLPGDADGVALVRRELSWPGRMGPVPSEVAGLVRAAARRRPLAPVARLNTERRRVVIVEPGGRRLAEVDDDIVSVLDGRRLAARFREGEVELANSAPPALLELLVARIVAAGAVPGDQRPKVVRAIGPRAAQGPDVVVPALDASATVADVVRAAVAAGVTRMIRHDPGVRLGDDPEHVHQARVGTRRLRSDLRTFRPLLDRQWAEHIRNELGWVAAALGEVRDADVLTERLRGQVALLALVDARPAAGLLRRLALQRDEARVRLLEVLDSDRYVTILDELCQAAAEPQLAAPPGMPAPAAPAGPTTSPSASVGAVAARSVPEVARRPVVAAVGPKGRHTGNGLATTGGLATNGWQPAAAVAASSAAPPRDATGVAFAGPTTPGDEAGPGPVPSGAADRGAAGEGTAGEGTADRGAAGEGAAGEGAADRGAAEPGAAEGAVPGAPGPGDAATGTVTPRRARPVGDQPAREVLPALVRRPWRHLRAAVDALGDDPPDELLHEVRIRAKRLRYAAEAVTPVLGRPARRIAAAAADVQGVLGDFNDAVVAEAWLRAESGPASQALVAGQLIAMERDKQELGRRSWRKPWRVLADPRLREWLRR